MKKKELSILFYVLLLTISVSAQTPQIETSDKSFVFVSSRDDIDGNDSQNTDIFYQKANSPEVKNVAFQSNGNYHDPDLSPDGNKILFVNNGDIYITNVDGSELNKITNTFNNNDPSWTSDGSGILFTSTRHSKKSRMFVMDLVSKDLKEIHTNRKESIVNPVFSPDGEKIAFASFTDRKTRDDIYIINKDGTNEKQITNDINFDDSPSWSPDGQEIIYSSWDMSDITNYNQIIYSTTSERILLIMDHGLKSLNSSIKLVSIEDLNPQILIESDKQGFGPCWSSDGNSIIFTSNMSGNDDIFIMDPNGSNIKNLTNNKASDHAPKF